MCTYDMEIIRKLPFDLKLVVLKERKPDLVHFFDQKFKLHNSFYSGYTRMSLEIIYKFVKHGTKENRASLIKKMDDDLHLMGVNSLTRTETIMVLITTFIASIYLGNNNLREATIRKLDVFHPDGPIEESEILKHNETNLLIREYLEDPKYFVRYQKHILF
jgi:hypothetical protein